MRCKFCGSQALRPDKEHRNFSIGKAAAGAVAFGPIGSVSGFVGKDLSGYRCGACGAFMDAPMDLFTEHQIDNAISDAEAGRGVSMFQYYRRQYPNIRANIPVQSFAVEQQISKTISHREDSDNFAKDLSTIKHTYHNLRWNPDCPIYTQGIVIHTLNDEDTLTLVAWNQSQAVIRSAYYTITVYDDTGDEIGKQQCVYQGLSVAPGKCLPTEKAFPLQTDLAYRVELFCKKVSFSDDAVWRAGEADDDRILIEQPELTPDTFPRLKYVRQHLKEVSKLENNAPIYLPIENEEFWQCICGQPVLVGCTCLRCGADLPKLNHLLSQEHLRKLQQKSVKEIAAKRAMATMKLYTEAINHEKETAYKEAVALQEQDTEASLTQAMKLFEFISSYEDSVEREELCRQRIEEVRQAERVREKELQQEQERQIETQKEKEREWEREKKHNRVIRTAIGSVIVLVIAVICIVTQIIIPGNKYAEAEALLASGKYDESIVVFSALGNYKDSSSRIIDVQEAKKESINAKAYMDAEQVEKSGDKISAAIAFGKLKDYRDSKARSFALWDLFVKRDTLLTTNSHTVYICDDGTVNSVGSNYHNCRDISNWEEIIDIAAGEGVTVGLRKDGTLVTTNGWDLTEFRDVVAIDMFDGPLAILFSDGTVTTYGKDFEHMDSISKWDNVIAISASISFIVGLKQDGTVCLAGAGNKDLENVYSWSDIIAIDAGWDHVVGLKNGGNVVGAGDHSYGELDVDNWQNVSYIFTGTHQTIAVLSNGSVLSTGQNNDGMLNVSDWSDICTVSAGWYNTVGLTKDGGAVAVGRNYGGNCDVQGIKEIKIP